MQELGTQSAVCGTMAQPITRSKLAFRLKIHRIAAVAQKKPPPNQATVAQIGLGPAPSTEAFGSTVNGFFAEMLHQKVVKRGAVFVALGFAIGFDGSFDPLHQSRAIGQTQFLD